MSLCFIHRSGRLSAQDDGDGLSPGLVAAYSDGERGVALVVPTPHFSLAERESIHPQLSPGFTAEWTGFLRIFRAGTYTISGDARVFVGDREVQNRPADLTPGEHPLRIAYRRPEGPARLQLRWESDFFRPEPVPGAVFGHRDRPEAVERQARVERGRDEFESLHCAACHRPAGASPPRGRIAPNLSRIGSRATARWIVRWLEDPGRFRPGASMPVIPLSGQERADVAAYLAGLRDPAEAAAAPPPDASRVRRGREIFGAVGCAACHDDPLGVPPPPAAGAPAASPMQGRVPLSGLGSKTTAAALARYLFHPLAVHPGGRMPALSLSKEESALLADFLVQSRNPAYEAEVPDGDAGRGKALVVSRGCVACHAIREGETDLANALEAPSWEGRFGEVSAAGCLSDAPAGLAPHYGLSRERRDDIRAFLSTRDRSEAPVHEFYRAVRSLRCIACHALDASVPPAVTEFPPSLTGAGDKLRPDWLNAVLAQGRRIRPWMQLRMPHYGQTNVGRLVHAFAAASGAEPGDSGVPAVPPPDRVREGVRLIGKGEGGLACIGCHDFRTHASLGTRGPDMTEMGARLRPDWFRRWMRAPSRLQPGTAMPSFFKDPPDAKDEAAIDALWDALAAGPTLPLPAGLLAAQGNQLRVRDDPVLLRTFMPDSSPRSIAVGLPGAQSYCFDAEACRLRYAWTGDFLDASPSWEERGGHPSRLLGKRYYVAPDLFPLRLGDPEREPPRRFLGYTLDGGPPEFRYTVDGVEVRERITVAAGGRGIVLRFEIGAVDGPVWFLAGEAVPGVTVSCPEGEWTGRRLKLAGGPSVRFAVTVLTDEGKK